MKFDSELAHGKFIAFTFIEGTYQRRTGKLEEYLSKNFSLGFNRYQYNLENGINMIINYKNYVHSPNHPGNK